MFRPTRPILWRKSTTNGTATTKSTATAHMDRGWIRCKSPPPPPWTSPWRCYFSSQWPTSPSLDGWATRDVTPPVFPPPLPVSSEHQESYRCSKGILFQFHLTLLGRKDYDMRLKHNRIFFVWSSIECLTEPFMIWFQAVGKDGIYPGVGWFEVGGNANNDPIRGVGVFNLDGNNSFQAISYVLRLRWVLWWLQTSMRSESWLLTSSSPGG